LETKMKWLRWWDSLQSSKLSSDLKKNQFRTMLNSSVVIFSMFYWSSLVLISFIWRLTFFKYVIKINFIQRILENGLFVIFSLFIPQLFCHKIQIVFSIIYGLSFGFF
jgi:hypothetical protein